MRRDKCVVQWLFGCFTLIGAHAWAQDSVTYVYTDPQGTTLAEADASGNITATFEYTPYGTYAPQGTSKPGPIPSGPGYTGHVNDPETNLVYMQARYYDPATGRFLSIDPNPPTSGDVFGFNRNAYANNNPIKNIDPNGRNAIITTNADGSISIQVPINFSGPAASGPNITAIKEDVAARWSGVYNVNGELTKVSVAVTDVTADTPSKAVNNITLLNGPTSDKAAQGASFVGGNHVSGEWNMTSSGMKVGEAAHETGHLMGDADYYTDSTDANGNRISKALDGYGKNLMGALSPVVITDSRNMNVILRSPINMHQSPPPPPPPPPLPPPPRPNQHY